MFFKLKKHFKNVLHLWPEVSYSLSKPIAYVVDVVDTVGELSEVAVLKRGIERYRHDHTVDARWRRLFAGV